jgi:hypothetical protein
VWPAKLFLNFANFISKAASRKANMAHGVTDVLMLLAFVSLSEHVSGKCATVDPELKAVIH